MNAAKVKHQNAVDEDEEVVVTVEAQLEPIRSIVDKIVMRLIREIGVVSVALNGRDPAAIAERILIGAIGLKDARWD